MSSGKTPVTYPVETASRSCKDLSGLWKIVFDFHEQGEETFGEVSQIPPEAQSVAVPGSYNDQFTEKRIRDFVGQAWYYRQLHIPDDADRKFFLRFASANYTAKVFLDGQPIGEHGGGHLPFTLAVPEKFVGHSVLLAVMVDNNLTPETIPPGRRCDYTVEEHGVAMKKLEYHFDFFHYCGLNRQVHLLSTPRTFTADATIVTQDIGGGKRAVLSYDLDIEGKADSISIRLSRDGVEAARIDDAGAAGELVVENPQLWEAGHGRLYDFTVTLHVAGKPVDEMTERIGIRTVRVEGDRFLLNDKPVYFKGYGRHEDFIVCGRNLPDAVLVRDFELMKWMHANSFRTSHYPYSEQTMQLADEMGFLVIDETPAVGLQRWGEWEKGWFDSGLSTEGTLQEHCRLLEELIRRDKNRACVVMWSVANEAATGDKKARPYFETLANLTRSLDATRPVTNVIFTPPEKENTIDLFDVICLNRYVGWYVNPGDLEVIQEVQGKELDAYHEKYNKPILLSEFGADTIEGAHALPARQFSEEYQAEFIEAYCDVLDSRPFVIGEHAWNFADFMTKQETARVMGNRKGLFTRDRQPKLAAHLLRKRWSQPNPQK